MLRDHGFFFDGTTYTQYDVPGAVHTDVTLLGQIAESAGVRALVASHLGPGDNSTHRMRRAR